MQIRILNRMPVAAPGMFDSRVLSALEEGCLLLVDGGAARCAASCLLAPAAGDRVLVTEVGGERFVLHVLERASGGVARVRVAGADELTIEQRAVTLLAEGRLTAVAGGDLELTSAGGNVALNGRNLMIAAADAVIESARHRVSQVHHYLLQVRDLWRVQSRDGLLTAERELKVDAERVSVG